MKPPRPVGHHRVSKFYLRGFADGELLCVHRKDAGRFYPDSVERATVTNEFYTVTTVDEARSPVIENMLAKLEKHAAPALRAAVSGTWPLPPELRIKLALWLAALHLRSAVQREVGSNLADGLLKLLVAFGGPTQVQQATEDLGLPTDAESTARVWQMLVGAFDRPWVAEAPETHAQRLLEMLPGVTNLLLARQWQLVRFERKVLATSDAPLLYAREVDDPTVSVMGVGTATAIALPLDRHHALIMGRYAAGTDATGRPTARLATALNGATTLYADREFLHHPDDATLHELGLSLPAAVTRHTGWSVTPEHLRDIANAAGA